MTSRSLVAATVVLVAVGQAGAQNPLPGPETGRTRNWNSPAGAAQAANSPAPVSASAPGYGARASIAKVTAGSGQLPNEHGQIWREYDISPYTLRVTSTNRPEQAIVDWILRETGYETWHGEPLGILSASARTLRVYHTPQVQSLVSEIVDRFVNSEAETQAFSLRIATVDSPSWRVRVQRLLVPVKVQTPGVQAWLLEKEAAALLLADLRRRGDFREQGAPNLTITNGQSTVVSATRGRNYIRNVVARSEVWPGFEPESGVLDEGFSLEFNPLLSLDGRFIDAAIKCEIDQIEKLIPVMLDAPTAAAPRQQTKVEVPQKSQFRFHERFRWPVDQVLLISMGVVATPVPGEGKSLVPGLPLSLPGSPPRSDLLVLVESRGKANSVPQVTRGGATGAGSYYGR